jgi:hypothetical protein
MTISAQIMSAVAILVGRNEDTAFTREEIRHQMGVDRDKWVASYSPIFQGMRSDHPGGAPKVAEKYRNVFRTVSHGKHVLTDDGRRLVMRLAGVS